MAKYQLIYFDLFGRGESIRYLLHDNGVDYEETLIQGLEDWPEWKTKMQFGQIPCLKDGDFQIVQSNAILRHLGRKHNLYGESVEDATRIDMLSDGIEDLRKKYVDMIYGNYENGKAPYIAALPEQLKYFEKILAGNDAATSGCCVGGKASLVDYNMFDILTIHLILSPTCLDSFPTLSGFHKLMLARPKLNEYRQTEIYKKRRVNYGPNQ